MESRKDGPVTRFIVKLANHLGWVVGGYVVAIGIGGVLFYLIEGQARGLDIIDTIYWADITASTVGYGDIAPVTVAGKVLTFIYLKLTAFAVVPLVIVNIYEKVQRSKHEWTDEEQDWTEDSIQRLADHLGVELLPPPRDTSHD